MLQAHLQAAWCVAAAGQWPSTRCSAAGGGNGAARRVQEILPLKLFDHRQVQAARKTQALKKTGLLPSRPSERRGAEAEDAGATVIDPTVL